MKHKEIEAVHKVSDRLCEITHQVSSAILHLASVSPNPTQAQADAILEIQRLVTDIPAEATRLLEITGIDVAEAKEHLRKISKVVHND